jgi:hypothetical protein
LLLGEAHLQFKKRSKAIPYLNAAANHGKPAAHQCGGHEGQGSHRIRIVLEKQPNYLAGRSWKMTSQQTKSN